MTNTTGQAAARSSLDYAQGSWAIPTSGEVKPFVGKVIVARQAMARSGLEPLSPSHGPEDLVGLKVQILLSVLALTVNACLRSASAEPPAISVVVVHSGYFPPT